MPPVPPCPAARPSPPMRLARLAPFAVLALAAPAGAQVEVSGLSCSATPTGHIEWPAGNPVWSLDFVRPQRSSGTNGSGLELRDVYYQGRLVFKQAHVPILNVEYDAGGCGCFRDWQDEEVGYRVRPPSEPGPSGCYYEAAPGDVYTTCDSNLEGGMGGDTGTFSGVAVEDFGEELVLTAHMQAGWYRYRMKWHLYADGRIWPEFSFSAESNTCTQRGHRHHAYWRFDFDVDGASGDLVREVNPAAGTETTFTQETARTWGAPASGVYWTVEDEPSGMRYEIVPGSADLALPADDFSQLDFMALRYDPTGSVDDGISRGGTDCAIEPERRNMLNGESLVGQDVVVWYRSSALHSAGHPWECDLVGPMLRPFNAVAGEPDPAAMPDGYRLERAYPNPFNPSTSVRFTVAEPQRVTLALYDALGRRVATLFEGFAQANRPESVRVDGSGLPSGTYTVRLDGETVRGSIRIVLVR